MAQKKSYLGNICEPINREEFAEKMFDVVVEAGINAPNVFNNMPNVLSDHEYKSYLLRMFSGQYRFGKLYEIRFSDIEGGKENEFLIQESVLTYQNKEYGFFIKEKECLISVEDVEAHCKKINDLKLKFPNLNGRVSWKTYVQNSRTGKPVEIVNECEDIAKFIDYTDWYMKDMKNANQSTWQSISCHTADAKQTVKNIANDTAKETFLLGREENKLLFAKSLFVYCQGIRFLEDVPKIARRFINMGKYIDGESVESSIMCFFNSDTKTGRNGKTYRMKLEKEYMERNGFITSTATLNKSRLTDVHVFSNHFYYIDEYDFNDTTPEMMKTINKNENPTFSVSVMYQGQREVNNDCMFILSCHNGRIRNLLMDNERCLDAIRWSDAKYEDNKDSMAFIYREKNGGTSLIKDKYEGNQTVATFFNNIKAISDTELFNGLLKYSKGIEIPSEYFVSSSKDELENFTIDKALAEVIENIYNVSPGNAHSCYTIYTKLGRAQYYTDEKAKNEVKLLFQFLKYKNPEFIVSESPNWISRRILINKDFVDLISELRDKRVIETEYSLIDNETLWNYIIKMLGLNPSQNIKDIYDDPQLLRETYAKLNTLFVQTNEHKMVDPNGLFEGVNIPKETPSEGHISLFSNDNLFFMSRFLVEYDPPQDTAVEEIVKIKQDTINFFDMLPTFRMVDSGNKSIHTMFCFDYDSCPETVEEYKFAVEYAKKHLGLPENIGCAQLDTKVLYDPSRICRRPGVMRPNGNLQKLISYKQQMLHIEWKPAYLEHKRKQEQKKRLCKQLYSQPVFGLKKLSDIDVFIRNYCDKHYLVWTEGNRHTIAAKIAGACAVAGFAENESVEAIERNFDCSNDKTILSNLHKFFNN